MVWSRLAEEPAEDDGGSSWEGESGGEAPWDEAQQVATGEPDGHLTTFHGWLVLLGRLVHLDQTVHLQLTTELGQTGTNQLLGVVQRHSCYTDVGFDLYVLSLVLLDVGDLMVQALDHPPHEAGVLDLHTGRCQALCRR